MRPVLGFSSATSKNIWSWRCVWAALVSELWFSQHFVSLTSATSAAGLTCRQKWWEFLGCPLFSVFKRFKRVFFFFLKSKPTPVETIKYVCFQFFIIIIIIWGCHVTDFCLTYWPVKVNNAGQDSICCCRLTPLLKWSYQHERNVKLKGKTWARREGATRQPDPH